MVKYIIGIDEAGRGPLAGPVVVAGVKVKFKAKSAKFLKGIKDSKKLSVKQREEWFRKLTDNPKTDWAVAKIWPRVIDRINISQAANLGALRVYKKLNKMTFRPGLSKNVIARSPSGRIRRDDAAISNFPRVSMRLFPATLRSRLRLQSLTMTKLDGGLILPFYILHETIIRGDEKIPVISAASIIAKVTRDRLMLRLHKKYPQYRFDAHKGYPTKLHRYMIKIFGRSNIHRKTFRIS